MPLTVYTAMRNYRAAYRVTADLKHKHDKLVAEQREILIAVEHASAAENKAREAMLVTIQQSNSAGLNETMVKG